MTKPRLSKLIFWAVILLMFFPIVVMISYSFNASKSSNYTGFSLKWYEVLFQPDYNIDDFDKATGFKLVRDGAGNVVLDAAGQPVLNKTFHKSDWQGQGVTNLWKSFGNSLLFALTAGLVATLLGTLAAIAFAWYRFRSKATLQALSFMPLVLPEVILGIALMIVFSSVYFIPLGPLTVLIAHITFCLPFVIMIIGARLAEFDYSIIEASRDLGAKEHQTLLRVILPIAVPGIIGGFMTAFTLSLEDFVVTFFVNGPGQLSQTLPMYLWGSLKKGIAPAPYINAFTTLLVLATVALVLVFRRSLKYFVK